MPNLEIDRMACNSPCFARRGRLAAIRTCICAPRMVCCWVLDASRNLSTTACAAGSLDSAGNCAQAEKMSKPVDKNIDRRNQTTLRTLPVYQMQAQYPRLPVGNRGPVEAPLAHPPGGSFVPQHLVHGELMAIGAYCY